MKCHQAKKKIIPYLYQALTPEEKASLEKHLQECPHCQAELKISRLIFEAASFDQPSPPLPEVDWEKNWSAIARRLPARIKHRPAWTLQPRWVYGLGLLIVVFFLGLGLGYFWLAKPPVSPPATGLNPQGVKIALKNYLEDIKPILIDWQNLRTSDSEIETVVIDKNILQSLLFQNHLLREVVGEASPEAITLLDDLDLILKEMANQSASRPANRQLIKSFLQEKDILFKLEILSQL
jgi:hypothetical protein